jgi:hypothetical protein
MVLLDSFGYDLLDTYNPVRAGDRLIKIDCTIVRAGSQP